MHLYRNMLFPISNLGNQTNLIYYPGVCHTKKNYGTRQDGRLAFNQLNRLHTTGSYSFLKMNSSIKVKCSVSKNDTKLVTVDYSLESFHRSNQDTSLFHTPAVFEGQWVESGDLLADCSTSVGGDLSLGQNLLIGYMPWEGYNFEDAILISERLVYDDLYTSIHIEKYEIDIRDTKLGIEQLTKEIPDLEATEIEHLDNTGIVQIGSWVEQGDILVGKVTPIEKKKESPYQKLLHTILDKKFVSVRDSSLRAPKGTKAKVINIQFFKKNNQQIIKNEKQTLLNSKTNRTLSKTKKGSKTSQNLKTNYLIDKNLVNFSKTKLANLEKKLENHIKKEINFTKKEKFLTNSKKEINLKPFFNSQGLISKRTMNQRNSLINQINTTNLLFKFKFSSFLNEKKKIRLNLNKIYKKQRAQHFFSAKHKNLNLAKLNFKVVSFFKFNLNSKYVKKKIIKNETSTESRAGIMLNPLKLNSKSLIQQKKTSLLNSVKQNYEFNSFISKKIFIRKKYQKFLLKNKLAYANKKDIFKNINPIQRLFFFRMNDHNLQSQSSKFSNLNSIRSIHIYLADKRKIQVGDKMSGRHGNKGIVSQILPREDMPYLPDGTPLDMVLNPLGVPSRMNVGQIYECLLGFAGKYLGEKFKILPFDEIYGPEASRSFVYSKLYEARIKTGFDWIYDPNNPGKMRLFDGRTGDCFDQKITVGQSYILRLVHMVDDKIHARSTGPYSLVTQQPLRGRSKQGGQRLGEMEVWALEGYGAAFTLLEMLTIKSDDMAGRMTLWSNILLEKELSIGTPESFKVLICELQALCLDIGLFRPNPAKNYRLEKIENLLDLR